MTTTKLCLIALCTLVSTQAIVPAAPAAAQICEGDCNGDGSVAIGEIILGVRIAFGDAPIGDCPAMDGDGNGAVAVNELVAAVSQALQGCGGPMPSTSTPTRTNTPVPTSTPVPPTSTPTRTSTPVPTTGDEAALAASARVATDPILRLFDLQASIATAATVAPRARVAAGGAAGVSGCQQLHCPLFGTQEICCFDSQFSQFFDGCTFDDDLGRVSLTGLYVLDSDSADVCTGAIPVGESFHASLSGFTDDVFFPDGSFSRTFQELSETFEVAPGGCTVSEPDQCGFAMRGDGRRVIDGELQQFQSDGSGNLLVDIESDAEALAIAVDSTQEPNGCTIDAALNGSVTNADVRVGTQFATDFTNFHVVQHPQAGALLLELNGTVGTDCLGHVTLSTIEPVRIASGATCFTAGRLQAQLGDETASVTYTGSGGVDLDFGADGSVDQHFASCTDVPADKCGISAVALCGACSGLNQCQTGLGCFPCSATCSGNTSRCSLSDTFVTCEDGVF
jgi:hypothetical protein